METADEIPKPSSISGPVPQGGPEPAGGPDPSAEGEASPASPPESWPRRIRRHVLAIGGVYLAWMAIGFLAQRSVVFPRYAVVESARPGEDMPGLERSWRSTDEGIVEEWFVPGDGVTGGAPGPAVVLAHGNAELIDHQGRLVRQYQQRGISVLLLEYRGYGRSEGSPSEAGLVADLAAAYDDLVLRPEVDAERIVLHGRSVGSGVVCGLSRVRPARAIVLESPFRSLRAMLALYGLFGPVVRDPMENLEAARAFSGPLLVMHGVRDEIIPVEHGEAVAAAAPEGTFLGFDCGHNDLPIGGSLYWEALGGLLERAGMAAAGGPR